MKTKDIMVMISFDTWIMVPISFVRWTSSEHFLLDFYSVSVALLNELYLH